MERERFVAKGGGTTGANTEAISNGVYGRIAKGELNPVAVVCSAPGKIQDESESNKLTDYAKQCIDAVDKEDRPRFSANFEPIYDRFYEIADGIGISWNPHRKRLEVFKKALEDGYAHSGVPEIIFGHMLAEFFPNGLYIPPNKVFSINEFGYFEPSSIYKGRRKLKGLPEDTIAVIPGFVGAGKDNVGTTARRGGSDTSAAYVACALELPCIIYTDTNGILSADPNIPGIIPKELKTLTYAEIREAAIVGDTYVVNAGVADPLEQMDGTLEVRHYRHSDIQGTTVLRKRNQERNELAAIVTGKPYHVIRIVKPGSDPEVGFNFAVARAFADNRVPVHHIFTETEAIVVTTDRDESNTKFEAAIEKTLDDVKRTLSHVNVERDIHGEKSVISVIGVALAEKSSDLQILIGGVFKDMKLNPNPFGFSGINYSTLVPTDSFEDAARRIHEVLVV